MIASGAHIVVIGAGMGGLASAIRLAHAGCAVTLIEAHDHPGGKMRTLPTSAGPADAGPTVLTMRHQFDALFALAGERMEDHLDLVREPLLARHWWVDGSSLDLVPDSEANAAAIDALAGPADADAFRRFDARAKALFAAFEAPMMETGEPRVSRLALTALGKPELLTALLPGVSMAQSLARQFRDPRLRQLFGRYATYVGGMPDQTPSLLQLVWEAEARGVWCVRGGLYHLAEALRSLAERLGVTCTFGTKADRLEQQSGRIAAVCLEDGRRIACDGAVFNGDPMALALGHLGEGVRGAVKRKGVLPRSLSARVWAFAAGAEGPDLAHHNVFFGADPEDEFGPIAKGAAPADPTLYVCAQDRIGAGPPPDGPERFEIIENAAPSETTDMKEKDECRTRVFTQLARHGLTFTPRPTESALTTPGGFHALFPGSFGSLYGRSPHGTMAALDRPRARTPIKGLYLAGGGTHPGAGIAMAALSGKHAAEAIVTDLASPSTSRRTAMPGGISTESPIAATTPSRSSPS
ncbi:phytoene desaturase [Alphaproteobacteria bacterium GH1-50]|uniref:Phytoene desaturase n=1 Tax=Kangsaoukella pontilimi TaxID=2691042 RepID=A0A7C9MYB5_9RHOB|nr:1-hydroxycarotenoid 3,4-desaturase CrtD [Kangsaoukella pontilimi]MXQ09760.1 phytoene desaturase [Kangsaoukella pontilimi]